MGEAARAARNHCLKEQQRNAEQYCANMEVDREDAADEQQQMAFDQAPIRYGKSKQSEPVGEWHTL
eukprot:8237220-Karenia_brevis.AAC.1